MGWVYTFPGLLCLPRRRTWGSFLVDHLDVPRVHFILGGNEIGSNFFLFFRSVTVPLDFRPNGILLRVGSVPSTTGRSRILLGFRSFPLTTGQSISGIFSEGFRLWTGFGPLACHCVFTIFSWKLGIVAVSYSVFKSWNHSVGPSF